MTQEILLENALGKTDSALLLLTSPGSWLAGEGALAWGVPASQWPSKPHGGAHLDTGREP